MVDAGTLSSLYEPDADYAHEISIASNHRRLLQWHHHHTLAFLAKCGMPSNNRVLDVGCHTGFFVRELVNRGFDAAGIDPNASAVAFGESAYGLPGRISTQTLSDMKASGERFGIVTAFEVLEHVPCPAALLDEMLGVLEPKGLIALSVPSTRMCWRPPLDYPPHHLSRFTPESVRCLLEARSLKVVSHLEQMSIFELARHFFGSLLRDPAAPSLRGGTLRLQGFTTTLRKVLNIARPGATAMAYPVDRLLFALGVRYIGQLVIARA